MIRVSVLYPNKQGAHFDMDYYCTKHIPMLRGLLGAALVHVTVDEGIGGAAPGSVAPFLAQGHLSFESVEAFQKAFTPHMAQIQGDVPKYTDSQPTIQISNVKI